MEAVTRERCALILLDVMLPGEDGLAFCRRLRADPATALVPVIFLSALGEETDRVVGLELGADDYIVKPLTPRKSPPASRPCCVAPPPKRIPTRASTTSTTCTWI